MEKQRLLDTLNQLQAELRQLDSADPETLARLDELTNDIQRATKHGRRPESAAEIEPASGGVRDLLLKFEADYPQLSVSIGRVADALAAMGI